MVSTKRGALNIFLKNHLQLSVQIAEPKVVITKKIVLSIYNAENRVQNVEI